jgi:GDPmannose 4,6-dehydratase
VVAVGMTKTALITGVSGQDGAYLAKLSAHWSVVNYREAHNLYACSGVLFNHESPLRGREFVTRKVTYGLTQVALGKQDTVRLGNLDAKRDWGFAGEYVESMWKMLQLDRPDDYVLATGRATTVREFVNGAAAALGFELEWTGEGVDTRGIDKRSGRTIVAIDPAFYRPTEVDLLLGNPQKAKAALGWEAKTTLEQFTEMMAKADYDRIKTGIIRI